MAKSSKKPKAKKTLAKKSVKKTTKKATKKSVKKVTKKTKKTKKVVAAPIEDVPEVKEFDFSKAEVVGDRFKGKQIVLAAHDKVEELGHYIAIILEGIGHPEALVTDESTIYDFGLEELEIEQAVEEIGIEFTVDDYLIDIAEKMHEKDIADENHKEGIDAIPNEKHKDEDDEDED